MQLPAEIQNGSQMPSELAASTNYEIIKERIQEAVM